MTFAAAIFWCAAVFIAYTLGGYYFVMWLLARFARRPHRREPVLPRVSIVVAMHNAAALAPTKLENTLALDYPASSRQILVACDGPTDNTVEVVRSFVDRGVEVLEFPHRGKHFAQKMALAHATGDIIVFTDAGVALEAQALRLMARNFADPDVGAVSSEDRIDRERVGIGERVYTTAEMWLRRHESAVSSLIGLSGSFFAARRELCERWNPEQSSDFFIALNCVREGKRAVVDPEACGRFGTVSSNRAEFERKVRTIVHGLHVLFSNAALLNPLRYGAFSWQLFSHKLCRWLLPFAFLALLIANARLWNAGGFYRATLALQLAVYLLGAAALLLRLNEWRLPKLAGFFVIGNAATLAAWLSFCKGEKFVAWQPSRRA